MTSTTAAVKADAANRSVRTLAVNLGTDVLVAVVLAVAAVIGDLDLTDPAVWQTLAALVGKTVLTTIGSYVLRLYRTPPTKSPTSGETPGGDAQIVAADPEVVPGSPFPLELADDDPPGRHAADRPE